MKENTLPSRQQVADGADTWTATQYNALNGVAGQCRHEGGIAVVMARAALQQFNYDDEAMCPGYTAPRPSSVSEQEILTRLSPNPAQEQCEVIFGQPLSGSLILTDLAGKVHSTLSLEQASSLTLNTHALPNGIYSLRLLSAQGSRLTTQKLVVLH